MQLARLIDPRGWPELAVEARYRWRVVPPLQRTLSWPLPRDIRRHVRLRWPRAYQWPPFAGTGRQLVPVFRQFVDVEPADLPQPYKGNILTQVCIGGKTWDVALDVSDYPELEPGAVAATALTIKMQYGHGGYGDDPVVPGGYLPIDLLVYRMQDYLRALRQEQPDRYQVSGRFGASFAKDIRGKALDLLQGTRAFQFHGSLGRVRYSSYLREVAQSTVSIDLPGNGPLCYRLVEYLALGACIVAYPHACRMPVPLVDGEHLLYVREDLSDLVERCVWCLEHPDEARRLAAAASDYFDRYLHREQLVAYYLHTMLERLG